MQLIISLQLKKKMTTTKKIIYRGTAIIGLAIAVSACKSLSVAERQANKNVPASYGSTQDTTNSAAIRLKDFFTDPYLHALIDTALHNNQELNVTLQEIQVSLNEVRVRKGEYLPIAGVRGAAEVEKVGRYTSKGSSEATTDIRPGQATPEPLPDFMLGVFASWEVDIWRKLRNSKQSAFNRYLSSVEGKNFLVTNLVAEIARSYYELLALDNQLEILNQNIELQTNALKIVKLEKESTRVTELAVRKFEAEVYYTQSLQYAIRQKITEAENRINFLVGRFPQPVTRSTGTFSTLVPATVYTGIPSQLLQNRTDIRQAELNLTASRLDVKVAKAQFYPSLNIKAGVGFQAFNPALLLQTPESLLYSLAGDLVAPLINRNAIKANYASANAKQIQAVYNYERTILNAYIEVANQMAKIDNLRESYNLKEKQVQALNQSITISTNLFKSAKADYMEVLMTQRDALEAKFDLIETRMEQMNSVVDIYKALGGGWQ